MNAAQVPDRLVRVRVVVGEKTATVLPREDAGVAPLRVRSGKRAHVQDVHDEHVTRLGTVYLDRTAQNMVLVEVHVADVVGRVVVPDLSVCPVQALDTEVHAGISGRHCRYVRVPAIVPGNLLVRHRLA